jgi:hypothetical protein
MMGGIHCYISSNGKTFCSLSFCPTRIGLHPLSLPFQNGHMSQVSLSLGDYPGKGRGRQASFQVRTTDTTAEERRRRRRKPVHKEKLGCQIQTLTISRSTVKSGGKTLGYRKIKKKWPRNYMSAEVCQPCKTHIAKWILSGGNVRILCGRWRHFWVLLFHLTPSYARGAKTV